MDFTEINIIDSFFSANWAVVDYVYCTLNDLFFFNTVSKNSNTFFFLSNSYNFYFFELYSTFFLSFLNFELFFNVIFDTFVTNYLFYLELDENQFRKFISFLDPALFSIYHPEAVFLNKSFYSDFFFNFSGQLKISLLDVLDKYSLISPINFFMQMILVFFFIVIYLSFFCSFFSKNKNEMQLESEYLFSSLTYEVEKELFSIDDAIHCIFFLCLMFGSYFGFLFLAWDISYTEITLFFIPLVLIFIFIIFIPINLLYDFGLFFIAYLRGASNTSSLFFECVYDYIGLIAFFTRLLVQFVRLILMFVVYCIMHDAVMLQNYSQVSFFKGDSFWTEIFSVFFNGKSFFYFFCTTLPMQLLYWTYECLHTFFVVTVQFTAFFTIIFWLFLLFYTFFVYEKYEHHFDNLNKIHSDLRLDLQKLKNK
uniref:Ymf66-like protein n=1 Tax=Paramecium gigas TaxID=2709424 RepID=UPI001D0224DB|nr:Ymf66-like protein [Paramecium gigas]QVG61497.1 Ymf66-like protein [Paramecium gigas]